MGQRMMAGALNVPVSVMETAGEGGAWGIALLASYMVGKEVGETLDSYLEKKVFAGETGDEVLPEPEDVAGFDLFLRRYLDGLEIERAAVKCLPE